MNHLLEWLSSRRDDAIEYWPVSIPIVATALLVMSLTIWALVGDLPTGFKGKTLWDWIKVLGIPITVAWIAGIFGFVTQRANNRAESDREMNVERARETTLREYLDQMTNLILNQELQESGEDSPVRAVAQAHTFAALRSLNGPRKGILIQFLHESKLISKGRVIISLNLADLEEANLGRADLRGSDLSGANLTNAVLEHADLRDANLQDALLHDADLRDANLQDAVITDDRLADANRLVGTTMPDGSEMTEIRWEEFRT